MFCPQCGTKVPDNAAFCGNCGSPLINYKAPRMQNHDSAHTSPGTSPSGTLPPGSLPPSGYVLIPKQQLERMQRRNVVEQAWMQPPQMPPVQQPQTQPKKIVERSRNEQVPDPTFAKFIDAPEAPLPFWVAKVMIAIATFATTGWCIWKAWEVGTIRLLTSGVFENVPGIPYLILALTWLVSAICACCSRYSRGAASTSGIFFFFAVGIALTMKQNCPGAPMNMFAILSFGFALIMLISSAGGIHVNLDPI